MENVFDTPRPEGSAVVITNALDERGFATAGFDLATHQVVAADDPAADFHFEAWSEAGWQHRVIYTGAYGSDGAEVQIQDMGWTESFEEIGYAPPDAGWSETGSGEAIAGHTYVLLTQQGSSGYYAKIRVWAVDGNHITFDWAYQVDPWNRELAVPDGR